MVQVRFNNVETLLSYFLIDTFFKVKLVEKTVIEELGKSQPGFLKLSNKN